MRHTWKIEDARPEADFAQCLLVYQCSDCHATLEVTRDLQGLVGPDYHYGVRMRLLPLGETEYQIFDKDQVVACAKTLGLYLETE